MSAKRTRASYTTAQKLWLLELSESNPSLTYSGLGRRLADHVNGSLGKGAVRVEPPGPSTICDWKRTSDELREQLRRKGSDSKRVRKCGLPELERALIEWIHDSGRDVINVPRTEITSRARALGATLGVSETFAFSSGWLDNFLKRARLPENQRSKHSVKHVPEGTAKQPLRRSGGSRVSARLQTRVPSVQEGGIADPTPAVPAADEQGNTASGCCKEQPVGGAEFECGAYDSASRDPVSCIQGWNAAELQARQVEAHRNVQVHAVSHVEEGNEAQTAIHFHAEVQCNRDMQTQSGDDHRVERVGILLQSGEAAEIDLHRRTPEVQHEDQRIVGIDACSPSSNPSDTVHVIPPATHTCVREGRSAANILQNQKNQKHHTDASWACAEQGITRDSLQSDFGSRIVKGNENSNVMAHETALIVARDLQKYVLHHVDVFGAEGCSAFQDIIQKIRASTARSMRC